jgi:hypothetical protein
MERVLYRLCIAALSLAVVLGGLGPCFADGSASAATSVHSQHQHAHSAGDLAMPMDAGAHHNHQAGMSHDNDVGSPSSKQPAPHDHGCQKCCALCSAATVSVPTLPEANLIVTGHEFVIRADHLIAVQVLLDPGIPKTSV